MIKTVTLTVEEVFNKMWDRYSSITPSAEKIKQLFTERGEKVTNDHVAYRTLNDDRINIQKVSKTLLDLGYIEGGEYHFTEKKLYAKHFYHPTGNHPKVFISQLLVEEFSEELQQTMKTIVDDIELNEINDLTFLTGGRLWSTPSYETYKKLAEESEYAAWFYLYGYTANHFTIDVNKLENYKSLKEVNDYLLESGYSLNTSGGLIKGNKEVYLEQSSTMADKYNYTFFEGDYEVPSCFYEFAYRHPLENGELFGGFVAASANKIFESTNLK
tara:strand:+ start:257 stop:1072 length:816 start_codon:yes stop_codon:yes gene_type:complete